MSPALSVILCTYNPRPDLLEWALESVRKQTLAPAEFEFVLVDNNSDPPLDAERIAGRLPGVSSRVVREPAQGLVNARIAGIRATLAPLIVFVDDDNYLRPDYLAAALTIARENPRIGCFGGKTEAVLEAPLPRWKSRLLPFLGVRDYGPAPITSSEDAWGEWEPIGAGMVCRRDAAVNFVRIVEEEKSAAMRLGRSGRALMSGEDSLIAHAAYRLGYACSYQPALVLSHRMKRQRLGFRALARTLAGHGRSHVILQRLRGHRVERPPMLRSVIPILFHWLGNVRVHGLGAGTIRWCWDLGVLAESRREGS